MRDQEVPAGGRTGKDTLIEGRIMGLTKKPGTREMPTRINAYKDKPS